MKEFKLKNYTTSISSEKSIMEIEKMLSGFGATHIMKEYFSDGRTRSIAFKLDEQAYKLPANTDGVRNAMYGSKKVSYRKNGEQKRDIQAENTSWRIIRDWLHAQLSIIYSGQAKPDEVMLPYLWDGKRTLYSAYKEGRIALKEPEETKEFEQRQEVLDNE